MFDFNSLFPDLDPEGKLPFDWKYIPVVLLGLVLLNSTLEHYGDLFDKLAERSTFHQVFSSPETEPAVPIETLDLTAVPAEIPKPVIYTGSGEANLQIAPPEGPWVLHATGNAESGYFSVIGYDENEEYTETFVNTLEPYDGISFDCWQATTALEIYAEGDWRIELLSIYSLDTISTTTPISGHGDDVFFLERPEEPWALYAVCNGEEAYFSVEGYDSALEYTQLFVHQYTPYEGLTYDMSQTTDLLAVRAAGDWILIPVTASSLPAIEADTSISASGDAVFQVISPCCEISVSGNQDDGWLTVTAFDGEDIDWLVASSEPVNETIPLSFSPQIIAIEAAGDWSITLR